MSLLAAVVVIQFKDRNFKSFAQAAGKQQQNDGKKAAQRQEEELMKTLPITQFAAALSTDPKERLRRESKGKKYNQRYPIIGPGRNRKLSPKFEAPRFKVQSGLPHSVR